MEVAEIMYAEVALIRNDKDTDKLYTYKIPESFESELKKGDKVSVSFGRGSNRLMGFVFNVHKCVPDFKTKEIIEIFSPVYSLNEKQIDLCNWMRKKYVCTYAQAIKTILPQDFIRGSKPAFKIILKLPGSISSVEDIDSKIRSNASKQRKALMYLLKNDSVEESSFIEATGTTRASIDKLIGKGFILSKRMPCSIKIYSDIEKDEVSRFSDNMLCMLDSPEREACYLHYFDEAIKNMETVLIVSNEISEAENLFKKFSKRYDYLNPILYSGNLPSSSLESIQKSIVSKKTKMVFGTRNSVFLPFDNLGLIVVDRENEYGHKSDSMPKFHTSEIAEFLKYSHNARLMYSDISPSIGIYYKNSKRNTLYIGKNSEIGNFNKVSCVDMKKELKNGNKTMFSTILENKIRLCKECGTGIIILLNQKGHSTSVACRSCGYVMKCPSCGLSLKYYSKDDSLRCPHCSYQISSDTVCPSCGSNYYKYFGVGPEKVKEEIENRFHGYDVLLINSEKTKTYSSLQASAQNFNSGNKDIIITTELMLKKNLIKRPVLFSILNADMFLYGQDYQANERFFSMIRKIRSAIPCKELLIQSYDPSQMAVRHAVNNNYEEFYKEELEYRRTLKLPPFYRMAVFHIFGDEEINVAVSAENYANRLKKAVKGLNIKILGPSKNNSLKYKSKFKFQIVAKCAPVDIKEFMGIIKYVNNNERHSFRKSSAKLSYDIDSR